MDYSPLYISLKVALLATVFTIVFGVLAARYVVRLKRFQGLIDGIFTLPMILPPTVVGFVLLLIFGKKRMDRQAAGSFGYHRGFLLGRGGHRFHSRFVSNPIPHGSRCV